MSRGSLFWAGSMDVHYQNMALSKDEVRDIISNLKEKLDTLGHQSRLMGYSGQKIGFYADSIGHCQRQLNYWWPIWEAKYYADEPAEWMNYPEYTEESCIYLCPIRMERYRFFGHDELIRLYETQGGRINP